MPKKGKPKDIMGMVWQETGKGWEAESRGWHFVHANQRLTVQKGDGEPELRAIGDLKSCAGFACGWVDGIGWQAGQQAELAAAKHRPAPPDPGACDPGCGPGDSPTAGGA